MIKNTNSTPLVSVVVITYNSSKYVLETLESIKNQTYKNIELVISDDCSTDETVAICQEWLERNKNVFSDAVVITAEKNGGIPANCNQGLNNSHGEWIKLIAGDDLLLPECVELFLDAASKNPDASCFASDVYVMQDNIVNKVYRILRNRFPKNASKQLDNFIKYGPIPGPALFFKTDVLRKVGGYDESYPGFEDYPMYVLMALKGFYFSLVREPTVIYRQHSNSVSHSSVNTLLLTSSRDFDEQVKVPLIIERSMILYGWHLDLHSRLARCHGFNKLLCSFFIRLSDIYYWKKKIFKLKRYKPHSQVSVVEFDGVVVSDFLDLSCGKVDDGRKEVLS